MNVEINNNTVFCKLAGWRTELREHASVLREYLSTGYGLRFSAEIYGSNRENSVFHEDLQDILFYSDRHLRKSPEASGSIQENVI